MSKKINDGLSRWQRYRLKHKDEIKRKKEIMKKTPIWRAYMLVTHYNKMDKDSCRGKGDLTAKWIVDNIFTQPCAHCGKTGWDIIGCNRLDNSKPHTMDNVEPCCEECNKNEWGKEAAKKVYQYTLGGELIKIWDSEQECKRNGFSQGNISACCNGKRKTHKGYKWSYEPL